jgi:hypothetical protein
MDCAICPDSILLMPDSARINRQYNRQYAGRPASLHQPCVAGPTYMAPVGPLPYWYLPCPISS